MATRLDRITNNIGAADKSASFKNKYLILMFLCADDDTQIDIINIKKCNCFKDLTPSLHGSEIFVFNIEFLSVYSAI